MCTKFGLFFGLFVCLSVLLAAGLYGLFIWLVGWLCGYNRTLSSFNWQEFTGNTNANEMVKHDLNRPITAHFIRFVPVEWNYKPCMRVEVYGSAIGKKSINSYPRIVPLFFPSIGRSKGCRKRDQGRRFVVPTLAKICQVVWSLTLDQNVAYSVSKSPKIRK